MEDEKEEKGESVWHSFFLRGTNYVKFFILDLHLYETF